jgi:hypothetical protein
MTFLTSNQARPDPDQRRRLHWLPPLLLVVALAYLAAGLVVVARDHADRAAPLAELSGMLLPLRLFVLASTPAAAACTLLWAERSLADSRLRRAVRAAAVLAAGVVVIALAGGLRS